VSIESSRPILQIIIASTRPGRVGLPVGTWVAEAARLHGTFEVEVSDLAEVDLPLFNEPNHPRLGQYEHDHTRRWSETIGHSDAFVFVFPEYNYGYTAPLKNALDYLSAEWAYKPVVLVSYGGVSGGLRAATGLQPVLTGLRLLTTAGALPIPGVSSHVREGVFSPTDALTGQLDTILTELARITPIAALLRPTAVPPR
jgi:NAD(P)H-dependent FMN reductase